MTQEKGQLEQQQISPDLQRLEMDLKKVIHRLNPLIIKRINSISQNQFEKDDLYQEILIKIYKALKRYNYQCDESFVKYVSCLIKSVKCDYYRKCFSDQKQFKNLVNEYVIDYQINILNRDEIEVNLQRKEIIEAINVIKQYLTLQEQKVFDLYTKGYKPKEIANLLSIKDKVVYNAIQRCKMKIRHHLEYKFK